MRTLTFAASFLGACLVPAFALALDPKSDGLLILLPPAVKKACERLCPDDSYQAVRVVKRPMPTPTSYTVTFLHNSLVTAGRTVGGGSVDEFFQYTIELDPEGNLLEEQPHDVSESAVPKAVLDGYKAWNRNGVKGFWVRWGVGKERAGKRTYRVMLVLNQIDAFHAAFLEDGRLIKDLSSPTPVADQTP